MSTQNNNPAAPVAAFMIGAFIGVALGMLFAPRSGRESREALKQKARSNLDRMQEKINTNQDHMKRKLNDSVDRAKGMVANIDSALDTTEENALHRAGKHVTL